MHSCEIVILLFQIGGEENIFFLRQTVFESNMLLKTSINGGNIVDIQVLFFIFSHIWASSRENLSSGFPTKRVSNQSPQLQ